MRDFTDWATTYLQRKGMNVSCLSDSGIRQTAYEQLKETELIMSYQIYFNMPYTQWEREHWLQVFREVGYEEILANTIAVVALSRLGIFQKAVPA